jgi:C-terminal processing protease CtpA/Prc
MLIGGGKVWIDDASFEVAGRSGEGDEPPRELKGRALDNLVAFTRLLGYVRHFHPSDGAADADWNAFAITGMRTVEGAANAADLARALDELFRPLAPTVRVFPSGKRPALPADLSPPKEAAAIKVTAWRHLGFGGGLIQDQNPYSSRRESVEAPGGKVPESFAAPALPFAAELGGGVACFVPLAVFADERGTLPHDTSRSSPGNSRSSPGAPAPPRPAGFRPSGNDRATRLAAVAIAWNIFQHFYPYFDVVKVDWPGALKQALKSAATDADEAAFLKTLRRLVAKLQDGHGHVSGPGARTLAPPPLTWDWVEEALVVTALAPDYAGQLKVGDVIREVDGRPAAAAIAAEEELISGATPQWRRSRALQEMEAGAPNSQLVLKVKPKSGKEFTEKLVRSPQAKPVQERRPEPIAEVKPEIFYVDLGRVTDATFAAALPRLEQARGLVFDLRTYPNNVSPGGVLSHCIDAPVTCPQWHVPKVTRPDRRDLEFAFSNWPVLPAPPRLKAKTAYITGGGAISYAETWLGIVEHYKLAAIVGGPTAGTNGNVNPVALPGRYTVSWTGMKVLKHDGSRHHGVGIQPTVPAKRTIAGVAAGKDELLERAIAEVSR